MGNPWTVAYECLWHTSGFSIFSEVLDVPRTVFCAKTCHICHLREEDVGGFPIGNPPGGCGNSQELVISPMAIIPLGMETSKNWSASSPKTVQMMPMIVSPGHKVLVVAPKTTDHLPRELTGGDPGPLWTTTHAWTIMKHIYVSCCSTDSRKRQVSLVWKYNGFQKASQMFCYRHTSLHLFVVNILVIPPAFKDKQDLRCARRYLQPGKQWFCGRGNSSSWATGFKGLRLTAGRRPSNDVWLKCFSHTFSPLTTEAKAYEPKTSAATRRYGSHVPRPATDEVFPWNQWEHLGTGNIWNLEHHVAVFHVDQTWFDNQTCHGKTLRDFITCWLLADYLRVVPQSGPLQTSKTVRRSTARTSRSWVDPRGLSTAALKSCHVPWNRTRMRNTENF